MRRRGVKKGMWISAAAALCPELMILPYNYPGYTEVSERVEEVLYDVADRMDGVVEPVSHAIFCEKYIKEIRTTESNQ